MPISRWLPWAITALFATSCADAPPVPTTPPAPSAIAPVATSQSAATPPANPEALAAQAHERLKAKDPAAALELYRKAWEAGGSEALVAYNAACAAALSGSVTDALGWLDRALDAGLDSTAWLEGDPDLASVRADPRFSAWKTRFREGAERRACARHVGEGLAPSTPEAEGLDPAALAALLAAAEKAGSSALVLVHDGKLAGSWYFGGVPHKIEAMSATKSIVSLAVGAAVDDGRIPSLDTPTWTWFPEWKQGRKQRITLRMLLNHTSGLQADATTEEIYQSPDFVRLALAAELSDDPGARFFYNNKAVNLLPEIVARASGKSFDDVVRERLFARLGIEDVRWTKDRASHPHGMSGLQIQPLDLAKIGQMILDGGTWKGQRVISAAWLDQMVRPAQAFEETCGLLWWIRHERDETTLPPGTLKAASQHGLAAALAARLRPLEDKPLRTREFWKQLRGALGDEERKSFWKAMGAVHRSPQRTTSEAFGYEAEGYLGQYLLVMPRARLVAVRMVDAGSRVPHDILSLPDFDALVLALTRPASRVHP